LAARSAERIGFSVHRRVIVLSPSVVATAQQHTVGTEQRGANRNTSLRQAFSSLAIRHLEHLGRTHRLDGHPFGFDLRPAQDQVSDAREHESDEEHDVTQLWIWGRGCSTSVTDYRLDTVRSNRVWDQPA
jgi:hypothetical protein